MGFYQNNEMRFYFVGMYAIKFSFSHDVMSWYQDFMAKTWSVLNPPCSLWYLCQDHHQQFSMFPCVPRKEMIHLSYDFTVPKLGLNTSINMKQYQEAHSRSDTSDLFSIPFHCTIPYQITNERFKTEKKSSGL